MTPLSSQIFFFTGKSYGPFCTSFASCPFVVSGEYLYQEMLPNFLFRDVLVKFSYQISLLQPTMHVPTLTDASQVSLEIYSYLLAK